MALLPGTLFADSSEITVTYDDLLTNTTDSPTMRWDVTAHSCPRYMQDGERCVEHAGRVFGPGESIYIRAKIEAWYKYGNASYKFTQETKDKLREDPTWISIYASGKIFKAPLVRINNSRTLVFKFRVPDSGPPKTGSKLLRDAPHDSWKKHALEGIKMVDHRESANGGFTNADGEWDRGQRLGGAGAPGSDTAKQGIIAPSGRWEFTDFKVDFEGDPVLDSDICRKNGRFTDYPVPDATHAQCSQLLVMASELDGLDWKRKLAISEWDGVTREGGVGRGEITSVDLSGLSVSGRIHNSVMGSGLTSASAPAGIDSIKIPQLNIEYNKEWDCIHTRFDDDGYIVKMSECGS